MKISKIVFMGTPQFAVLPLKTLIEHDYKPQICITQPDRPKGRKKRITPPEIKTFALDNDIEVLQPENVNSDQVYSQLSKLKPDVIVTASYGEYIGRRLRKLPKIAAVNIHPSLLPLYRGATPVNSALWNGDEFTGVTIFRLVANMDAGPILSQTQYYIKPEDYYTILLDKLFQQGADDLIDLFRSWENDHYSESPQDDTIASFCHKLNKDDFTINWNDSAVHIYNQIRALAEKPGAVANFRNNKLKIIQCRVVKYDSDLIPGSVINIDKSGILVAAGVDALLITKIHPAGKKIMPAYDFNLGARIKIKELFS